MKSTLICAFFKMREDNFLFFQANTLSAAATLLSVSKPYFTNKSSVSSRPSPNVFHLYLYTKVWMVFSSSLCYAIL
jgi:hypothetical protein